MQKHINKHLPIWQFNHLSKYKSVIHYVSGREGGVSQGPFESLNLSFSVSDDPKNVTENRQRLADELNVAPTSFVFPHQTHSANIKIVTSSNEKEKDLSDTDGLITTTPNVLISVLTADCVPLIFYDPVRQVLGVVHSGWRGTVKGIAREMIKKLTAEFQSKPSEILVGIGPSIGPDTYEVGENVITSVKETFGNEASLILKEESKSRAYLNLWKANRILLEHMRVPLENIEKAFICTYTDPEMFYSARRLGKDCGRFGAGIMLREQ
jgi:hypothetical protein